MHKFLMEDSLSSNVLPTNKLQADVLNSIGSTCKDMASPDEDLLNHSHTYPFWEILPMLVKDDIKCSSIFMRSVFNVLDFDEDSRLTLKDLKCALAFEKDFDDGVLHVAF
jgi:hypothetical protein